MPNVSALGPIDPASLPEREEQETSAPWIVRKLVGSVTGRVVMSSYETLRAAGTNIICLSPWGDSSPLFLPCIRFRDLAVHTVIAATGGMAAVAAPVMGPVADVVITSFGDTILVELGLHAGFDLTTKVANDLLIDKPINKLVPIHSKRLETTGVKILLITLKHKHTMSDASLGFYRSSVHRDTSLFASVKDYLAVEKGWFSPYLFASARRPIIPRNMKPDVIFCHGPFLAGDYRVGETLLAESAFVLIFCATTLAPVGVEGHNEALDNEASGAAEIVQKGLSLPSLSNMFGRSRTPSPEPSLTPLPNPPAPRRMAIVAIGLKPHRKLWTFSARPGESVINYILLNGCPTIVVPAKVGAPLLAWDGLTLKQLWNVDLPADLNSEVKSSKFDGIVNVIFEYLDLCVDWDRFEAPINAGAQDQGSDIGAGPVERLEIPVKGILKDAVALLVAAAIRSRDSKEARRELDAERSGIAMWRIP